MKSRLFVVGLLLFSAVFAAFPLVAQAEFKGELKTDDQKFSYYMGMEFGSALKTALFKVDPLIVDQAIQDVLRGSELKMTRDEALKVRGEMAQMLRDRRIAMIKALADKNEKEGEAFLKDNLKKKGVKATASGLQYKILKKGTGRKPSAMDKVSVHYQGTLIDGAEFDSSYKRKEPVTIPLSGVIPGWMEGLQMMNVGSKYQFFIPSKLAYGPKGAGAVIGPNATLIFEVELLEIK